MKIMNFVSFVWKQHNEIKFFTFVRNLLRRKAHLETNRINSFSLVWKYNVYLNNVHMMDFFKYIHAVNELVKNHLFKQIHKRKSALIVHEEIEDRSSSCLFSYFKLGLPTWLIWKPYTFWHTLKAWLKQDSHE
jgi:hypothetical protein